MLLALSSLQHEENNQKAISGGFHEAVCSWFGYWLVQSNLKMAMGHKGESACIVVELGPVFRSRVFQNSIVNSPICSTRRVVIDYALWFYWVFILFDFLATWGLLNNGVQIINLHRFNPSQCRLTKN
ncbi:hypothetical protein BJP41_10370 (plasmid) [Candidatus Williamhamiltonella defendens]|uniref:Uncharacterized protein n=1 Tax=Candidatus Williamhamiltonella defendens TaxID=138072 RepID=A0A2D3T4Y1_9ENTR|nr:hypothetical protein BJP41_10370 [Candidatus Hamiltonella defensa]